MNYANYLVKSFQISSNLFNAAGECRNFASWKKKSLLGDLAKPPRRTSKTSTENKQTSKTTESRKLWIMNWIMTTDLTDLRNLQFDNLQFTIYVQFSNLTIYFHLP